MEQDVTKFWKIYELIGSKKNYLKVIEAGRCRICNKISPEATFNKEAHLISKFLDSHHLLEDECDTCNEQFSKWENDLANFIRPYITLLGISPGKSKVPSFQSRTENRDEETRTTLRLNKDIREFLIRDKDDYILNEDRKSGVFTFRKPGYTPLHLYKVLLKTALELFPKTELIENRYMCEWLLGRHEVAHIYPYLLKSMIYKKRFAAPEAWLYKARQTVIGDNIYPEYLFVFGAGNQVLQIVLPFKNESLLLVNDSKQRTLEIFPAFAYDKIEPETPFTVDFKSYDISIDYKVYEDEKIAFKFDSFERRIPDIKTS